MNESESKSNSKNTGFIIVGVIAIIAVLIFILSNSSTHDKNNHHDNICDNCGKTATYHTGDVELCKSCANDFYKWLNSESEKRGF